MWSACHSLTKLKYVSLHSIPKGMSTFASQFDTPCLKNSAKKINRTVKRSGAYGGRVYHLREGI